MTKKYLCIHGHFYQPPREEPYTGKIPHEYGAIDRDGRVFDNFNELITTQCYQPNAMAGNFGMISFDFGPTLLTWLYDAHKDVYDKIIASSSNALAQAYNHTILPLSAHYRDIWTQVQWGIDDYYQRFGRKPRGMWLPETAVNYFTLYVLASLGIEYTILAPWQAAVKNVDTTEPYTVKLPDEKSITVFFYNTSLSGPVSFDNPISNNASKFACEELPKHMNQWKLKRGIPQLLLIATDGELYGHHKPDRDQVLTRLLRDYAPKYGYEVVALDCYLDMYKPTQEIAIKENTAWSCQHKPLRRWYAGCKCTNNGDRQANAWKKILADSIHRLYHVAFSIFEEYTKPAIPGGHLARNKYIALRNGLISEQEFWNTYGTNNQIPKDTKLVYKVMLLYEAQYYLQQAYTSCGWFWSHFNEMHTQNNVKFAFRAMHLIYQATGKNLEDQFIHDLSPLYYYAPEVTTHQPGKFEKEMQKKYLNKKQ